MAYACLNLVNLVIRLRRTRPGVAQTLPVFYAPFSSPTGEILSALTLLFEVARKLSASYLSEGCALFLPVEEARWAGQPWRFNG
jgi:hypothetical protein